MSAASVHPRRPCSATSGRWLVLALLLLAVPCGWSCSVPVFRYALERWPPSPYELRIFHRGPLGPEEQRLTAMLDDATQAKAPPNLIVEWVDVDAPMNDDTEALWRSQAPTALPWMVLRFPEHSTATGVAAAGPATIDGLRRSLVSPARAEVVRRLMSGDSCVWLFVASGDLAADTTALARLRTALSAAEHALTLPIADPQDQIAGVGVQHQELPLRISFSILQLARDDVAEREFIALLTATFAPAPPAEQPFTIAVCGQGRGVEMLSGGEIEQSYIAAACAFIVGRCACEVKAEMPGSDLLIAADWRLGDDRMVRTPEMPDIAAVASLRPSAPQPPSSAATPVQHPAPLLIARLGWWATAGAALTLALSAWLVLRGRPGAR